MQKRPSRTARVLMDRRKQKKSPTPPVRPQVEATSTFMSISRIISAKKTTTALLYATLPYASLPADSPLLTSAGIDPLCNDRSWHPENGFLASSSGGAACRSSRCCMFSFIVSACCRIVSTCTQIRDKYPWLGVYDADWPATSVMKLYLRNNRNRSHRRAREAAAAAHHLE